MNDFYYKFLPPDPSLADFVESTGMFHNLSDQPKEVVIVPDGRVDLFFSQADSEPFHVTLVGLETSPEQRSIPAKALAFVISFKPLAVEYILRTSIAGFLDSATDLPNDFWEFSPDDLNDFDAFCHKALKTIAVRLPEEIDPRKRKLFHLIYASNGGMPVHELSEKTGWSSRQINRYFTQQFGLSLKSFCKILRFRASLEHIAQGRIFPELNFTDQNHFIKEIRKFSGVPPKELVKNENDRFILLSVLKQR